MSDFKFVVRTADGNLTWAGPDGGGLEKEVAEQDAKKRNDRAAKLGIKTRYEAVQR